MPPPDLTVSQWADENRILPKEAAAEPGRWNTERAEYQRGIMDAIGEEGIDTVVVMSSAQIGKTEIELNAIGFFIEHDPAPILTVYPTEAMAKAFSQDRLSTMIRDTDCLKEKVAAAKSRNSKNTILHKTFPGGHITLVGANSPANLAGRPIRVVLFDEVDRYPVSAGGLEGEGDVLTLAMKRTQTFFNRKVIMVSTPTIKGASRIEMAYDESDKRRYFVPCPGCGDYQILQWKMVKWDQEDGNHLPETAMYFCEKCGVGWSEKERHVAVRNGEWRTTGEYTGVAGFWINELYSPWSSLERIVRNFLEAKKDPQMLKAWVNTTLGETWEEEGDVIEDTGLMLRREEYDDVPADVGILVASVDVQDNRLECLVCGYGVDNEVWAIEHKIFYGDPGKPEVWQRLDQYTQGDFIHASGKKMRVQCTTVDSGGHYTKMVYDYCKKRRRHNVFAIKGSSVISNVNKPLVSRPSTSNIGKVMLFSIATDTGKDMLFSRLKVEEPGPAYIHFNYRFDEEFFSQLSAEKRIIKYYKGFPRREYKQIRDKNEAIDLFVYNFAAFEILNIKDMKRVVNRVNYTENEEEKVQKEVKRIQKRHKKSFVSGWK